MNAAQLVDDPFWYKDAIIYELHVKAFFDSNNDGVGDFPGLIQKLDYLQDLGVTCLWLLPFYPSPLRDDGYDIADYYNVHPKYGTLDDFQRFVEESHRRGLRVITELVVNHTSDQHPWFQAARNAPPGSPEREFYVWNETDQKYQDARIIFLDSEASNWTWDEKARAFYWHRFFYHQPDLNYDNPAVIEAVLDVMRFWLDMGVDGMRLDAIPYLVEREGTNCENLPETHAVLKQFRKALDEGYQNRIFLAEANQWPADVLPYFGNGDECHMAYHFPLMPRLFMALRQEDRHPIIEIMRQTPDIPEECQWAIFLRNHDELTLEMVTDQERDYMYNEYAADPQARLNLGIRRRLAPLLENNRLRVELLTSLLFSLPGTPFLYYGDELGMGDNIFLGDRDGVRTPMQWTSDRNAGFSRADFARLYLPAILDSVYNYQVVNVEMQQRDPSSLLNWMKRIIALRKHHKVFGRGSIQFLLPENRKVLAYLRRYEDEIVLCLCNLSRYVQPVELDLSEFEGLTPVEMFGQVHFPRIGGLPYFLTLGPNSFYWFSLEKRPESMLSLSVREPLEEIDQLPEVELSNLNMLMEGKTRAVLERHVLPYFLKRQRWFAGKNRSLETISIRHWAQVMESPNPAYLMIIETYYSTGPTVQYFVPISVAATEQEAAHLHNQPSTLMAHLKMPDHEAILFDGLTDPRVCQALLESIAEGRTYSTNAGKVTTAKHDAFNEIFADSQAEDFEITHPDQKQGNTSIFYNRKYVMKAFRQLFPGVNPDLEIGRFLTEQAKFSHAPNLIGSVEFTPARGEGYTLAILQERVPNQGSAWDLAVGETGRYLERVGSLSEDLPRLPERPPSIFRLATERPPEEVANLIGTPLYSAEVLGQRTAEMHLALAQPAEHETLGREPWTKADWQRIADRLTHLTKRTMDRLEAHLKQLPQSFLSLAERCLHETPRMVEDLANHNNHSASGCKTRIHGNFHLGEILWSENDFVILDFEGERTRSITERRSRESPLRDVGDMLRSMDNAAFAGLFHFTRDREEDFAVYEPWTEHWRRWVSSCFLRTYLERVQGSELLPDNRDDTATLIRCFVLERALIEVETELPHRPQWARIPLMGILELIDNRF